MARISVEAGTKWRVELAGRCRQNVLAGNTEARTLEITPRPASEFGQLLKNGLPQLLRFREEFLIFGEEPVELERLLGPKPLAQNHIPQVNRIRESGLFTKLF
jgi:hypothetical protein